MKPEHQLETTHAHHTNYGVSQSPQCAAEQSDRVDEWRREND